MAKRTIKQNEARRALWDKWQRLRATTEDALLSRIGEVFEGLKASAVKQLEEDGLLFARLGEKDEAVYTQQLHMMETYRDVITLSQQTAENIQRESPGAWPILNGICEVLLSRLEDQQENAGDINPVSQEKHVILEKAIAYAAREVDNMALQFAGTLQSENDWAALCAGTTSVEDVITRECFPAVYTYYKEALRFCLAGLDDLHSRKTARFYTELIEREWEELGNIINVQAVHLESEVAGVDASKVPTVHRVLELLRELYNHIGPFAEDLQKLMHTPPAKTEPCRSFEAFIATIEGAITVKADSTEDASAFVAALSAEANSLFNQLRTEFMKATYQLQRIISSELLLAEEIQAAFVKSKDALTALEFGDLPEGFDEKEARIQRDILSGIIETIEIKIESLTDSFGEFNKKGLGIIKDFTAEKPDIPDEERTAAVDNVHAAWIQDQPSEYSELATFFQKCWDGDSFKSCRDRVARQIATYFEKTEKSAFNYKKEVVLYEVCTYEEILTHSVSRLRESEWEIIRTAAAMLDDAFKDLEVLLKKNNINVIRPLPHDAFIAAEHEVLVAEKQEGFNRGEIIKIINSGYRQKDQVIIRANVIAAR